MAPTDSTLDLEHLVLRIRVAMLEAGLDRRQLAGELGISETSVKLVLNADKPWGRAPSLDRVAQIAQATDKPLAYFFAQPAA